MSVQTDQIVSVHSKMNPSSPPIYGSTKQKNKSEKVGSRTIIDIHSCLDFAFILLWLFSICARPTIISTIHLLLFGFYIIIGGIILYETTNTKKKVKNFNI